MANGPAEAGRYGRKNLERGFFGRRGGSGVRFFAALRMTGNCDGTATATATGPPEGGRYVRQTHGAAKKDAERMCSATRDCSRRAAIVLEGEAQGELEGAGAAGAEEAAGGADWRKETL